MTGIFLCDEHLIEESKLETPRVFNEIIHKENTGIRCEFRIFLEKITVKRTGTKGVRTSYGMIELREISKEMFGYVPMGGKPVLVEYLNDKHRQAAMIENNRLLAEMKKKKR